MVCEIELTGEGEPIEGYQVEVVIATADEECHECERAILAGAEMEIVSGEFCGDGIRWTTCMDCMHIAQALSFDRIHGTLWSDLEECDAFEGFNSGCLKDIETASAKAYIQERWRKWKGLEGK